MPTPISRSKPPGHRAASRAAGRAAWLGPLGASSGMHLVGLVVLPTLLGWGWWEWRKPKPGGLADPVTLVWAAAPSPQDDGDPEQDGAESMVPQDFLEPEIDWPEVQIEPREDSEDATLLGQLAEPLQPTSDRRLEGALPSGVPPVPLMPIASPQTPQTPTSTPILAGQDEAEESPEDAETPSQDDPQPSPAETDPRSDPQTQAEESGEPVQVVWEPTPWSEFCPEPPYASRFQRRKWQGTVVLNLTVEVDGSVGAVTVLQSSGHAALDEVARSTLATWRFQPGPAGAGPTEVRRKVEFRLP